MRSSRLIVGLLGMALVVALAVLAPHVLLFLAPALLLVLAAAGGWLPGERRLLRWRSRRPSPRPRRGPARLALPVATQAVRPRVRRALDVLAVRPPPVVAS
jgi:hypothetical protein